MSGWRATVYCPSYYRDGAEFMVNLSADRSDVDENTGVLRIWDSSDGTAAQAAVFAPGQWNRVIFNREKT